MCEASHFEEPRAVVPHAGICTGRSGNWPSYRDGAQAARDFKKPRDLVGEIYKGRKGSPISLPLSIGQTNPFKQVFVFFKTPDSS